MIRSNRLFSKPEFLREVQAGEDDWRSFLEAGLPAIEIDGELFVSGADFDAWIHDGDATSGGEIDPFEAVWTVPAAAVWSEACGEFAA